MIKRCNLSVNLNIRQNLRDLYTNGWCLENCKTLETDMIYPCIPPHGPLVGTYLRHKRLRESIIHNSQTFLQFCC